MDSDVSSVDYSSGDEYAEDDVYPASPMSYSSRVSRGSTSARNSASQTGWIAYLLSWILFPLRLLIAIPFRVFQLLFVRRSKRTIPGSPRPCHLRSLKRFHSQKDQVVQRATDKRRGVIEVLSAFSSAIFCIFIYFLFFLHKSLESENSIYVLMDIFHFFQ